MIILSTILDIAVMASRWVEVRPPCGSQTICLAYSRDAQLMHVIDALRINRFVATSYALIMWPLSGLIPNYVMYNRHLSYFPSLILYPSLFCSTSLISILASFFSYARLVSFLLANFASISVTFGPFIFCLKSWLLFQLHSAYLFSARDLSSCFSYVQLVSFLLSRDKCDKNKIIIATLQYFSSVNRRDHIILVVIIKRWSLISGFVVCDDDRSRSI